MRFFIFSCLSLKLLAQSITLEQAEELFLKNNYELLAQQFEQEASRGLVKQEKIWDNPVFGIEEALNPVFQQEKTNTNLQLSQLFVIAKRAKRVQIAQLNSDISQFTLDDTIRSLKLELRRTFYIIYYLNQNKLFYTQSISALQKTVAASERIFANRSILLSELMRLKSLLLNLESEHLELLKTLSEQQAQLTVLLGQDTDDEPSKPNLEKPELSSLDEILQIALEKRPDFKITQTLVKQEKINLSLQKVAWVPDFTLQAIYQQAGNYVDNYVGIALNFSLPIWDHAQGYIQNARFNLLAKQKREEQTRQKLLQEVKTAYRKAQHSDELFKRIDISYLKNYEELAIDMIRNYEAGNLGIVAFADFFESYRDSMIKIHQVQLDRLVAFEELNYAMGI